MKEKFYKLIRTPLFWIFILALILRIYKLGEFPIGFHVDEVKVGWNALSILKTGMDDVGNKLPLYYNSFGDYRPTGIFYLTIPSIAILGNNVFAVRLPSALFGALTIFPLYLIVLQLQKKKNESIPLIGAFFLAISSWHVEVSRATSEVVISTFFALFALYYLLKGLNDSVKKHLVYSFLLFLASYFFYHSIRILAPIFVVIICINNWNGIKSGFRKKVLTFVGALFLLTLIFGLSPESRKRMSQVSIFNDIDVEYKYDQLRSKNMGRKAIFENIIHSKKGVILNRFIREYGTYFSTDFLIGERARPYRYVTPGIGLLSVVEILLILLGVLSIIKGGRSKLPLLLLLVAPFTAALTTEDIPNLHRAFLMIPFLTVIGMYGFESIKSKFFRKAVIVLMSINLLFFVHMYFEHSQIHRPYLRTFELDNPSYRNIGATELSLKLDSLSQNYEKIIITNYPDEVYSWYAFFANKDPKEFNQFAMTRKNGSWEYKNIVFSNFKCPSDDSFVNENEEKLLVIDAGYPNCAYQTKIKDGLPIKVKDKIIRSDGSEVYVFLERK